MFKPLSKVLVVVALLIAFIGQSLAYTAMSCEMSGDSHQSQMTMDHASMKSHGGMKHSDAQVTTSNAEDCCDVDCVCPENACTSITFINLENNSTYIFGFTEAVTSQTSDQPNSISSSLYRPPIFA